MQSPHLLRRHALAAVVTAIAGSGAASEPAARGADWVAAAAALTGEGFRQPSGAWDLTLPEDHAPHPETASEAWQLAVHLRDADGAPVGLQLAILRLGLVPPEATRAGSDWAAREIWRGHAILQADAASGEERFARGLAGLAGHDATAGELRLDDWSLRFDDAEWRLEVRAGDARAELTLAPLRLPGATGAGDAPFRGYAVTRLAVEGTVTTAAGKRLVQGDAWFEHLWGELPLPGAGPVASDRLIVQLDDGSDLSLVRTRRIDGRGLPSVQGALVAPDGSGTALDPATVAFEPVRDWQGRVAVWPIGWTLRMGDLELTVTPVADAAEQPFAAPVWIGLVRAEGQHAGRPVSGLGTLQLTGYGAP